MCNEIGKLHAATLSALCRDGIVEVPMGPIVYNVAYAVECNSTNSFHTGHLAHIRIDHPMVSLEVVSINQTISTSNWVHLA